MNTDEQLRRVADNLGDLALSIDLTEQQVNVLGAAIIAAALQLDPRVITKQWTTEEIANDAVETMKLIRRKLRDT